MDKYELLKEISHVKSEDEEEHERNIENMTQVDEYKSPWKDKDATTVNDTVNHTAYTSLNSWNDDISDSIKHNWWPVIDISTALEYVKIT